MTSPASVEKRTSGPASSRTDPAMRRQREEHVRMPPVSLMEQHALRPKPLRPKCNKNNTPPMPRAPPPSRNESASFESPRDPELVDVAQDWTIAANSPSCRPKRRPSIASARSGGRQSEISLGIVDFYLRDSSPVMQGHDQASSPSNLDAATAIDSFDFGLPSPVPSPTVPKRKASSQSNTTTGAERKDSATSTTNSPRILAPATVLTHGYSLFPEVQPVRPTARQPAVTIVDPLTFRELIPAQSSLSSSQHNPPMPNRSYRPRKESLSSSARSRAESTNSSVFRRDRTTGKMIPLRILSGSSSVENSSTARTLSTTTTATYSSPSSRWSDDTITSPVASASGGPRSSFTSLLRKDSAQYPACFFEDDGDEDVSAPLKKRLPSWATRSSGRSSSQPSKDSFDSSKNSSSSKFWKAMVCGCAGR